MGLYTGADLKKLREDELVQYFGKVGRFYYQIVRGIDDRPVQPSRETKSVGAEDTFARDLLTFEEMMNELERISMLVYERLERKKLKGRTITLKIKYSNFKQITRSFSLPEPVGEAQLIIDTVEKLLTEAFIEGNPVRLLGVSLSNFHEPVPKSPRDLSGQLSLF